MTQTKSVSGTTETRTEKRLAIELNETLHSLRGISPTSKRVGSGESPYTFPEGIFFGRDPSVLAMRISAASKISEIPPPEDVETAIDDLPDGREFFDDSSILGVSENENAFMDRNSVVALFHADMLEEEPKSNVVLDRSRIILAFWIDCNSGYARNGQSCCNRTPQFNNTLDYSLEEWAKFKENKRREALKITGSLLRKRYWI